MGILDIFKEKPQAPMVQSILPDAAKQEIMKGRLPILNTNKIFLKDKEYCHYIEKAIYEKRTVKKRYVRNNSGYSVPGLFKGDRIYLGGGKTDVEETPSFEEIRGILYITNQRIIFVGDSSGFEKKIRDLTAITPYLNCVELQFVKENVKVFVPNGNITHAVLKQIK